MKTDNGLVVAQAHGLERDSRWPRFERAYLKDFPACPICGTAVKVQVHHVFPFHLCVIVAKRPDLELDRRNVVGLCEVNPINHHLGVGHLGSFQSYNPVLRQQIAAMAAGQPFPKIAAPLPLAKWTPADKRAFCSQIIQVFGKTPLLKGA